MLRSQRPAFIALLVALIVTAGIPPSGVGAVSATPESDVASATASATAPQVTGGMTGAAAPDEIRHVAVAADTEHQHDDGGANKADKLVAQLQALLSHHATLAVRLTRATLTEDPGFVDAAEAALVRNIDDLESTLAPVLGDEAAGQLSAQWERQTQTVFQYAAGVRDDDADARRSAAEQLDGGVEEQSRLLAELSGGRIDEGEAADALRRHFDRQIKQLEAYGGEDYERAYELQRAAFAETFPMGFMTAHTAMDLPEQTPTDELQTSLAMLLGEHVELAVDTMRTGATGAADFEAAAATLDANTRDVTGAMDALFGAKKANRFNAVWADHIDLFVDYTVAVVEDDTETKQRVREEFDGVMNRFGSTLANATDGLVDAAVVTEAMGEHEAQLIDQIEQYANDDYSAAHQASYTAYQHIRGVADVLATAFADAVIKDMPRGGSDTGGGGTAGW